MTLRNTALLLGLLAASGLLAGCDDLFTSSEDEEGATVYLYNYDNDHEYRAELHLVSDSSLIESCGLDEYPDTGYADTFEDLDEGNYYVSVFRDNGTDETARSATFHLDDDETECFSIEDDGDVKNCS